MTILRAFASLCLLVSSAAAQPNVIVIITDDQGYGDLGVMGHPILRTPHLDALAAESALIEQFYVNPVCAPTRAALMTGLYAQRTTAIDTYIGRAMMEPEEVTIAEMLSDAGYATGIFGKWHLGDCSPMRPIDQGFDTSLVHRGGGIGQPSDPEGAERRYTDPILLRDDTPEQMTGYCTDIYFDEAAAWITDITSRSERPFFAYIATNAPHGPFHDVPADWLAHYQRVSLADIPPGDGFPVPPLKDADRLARIFAMISNIDENVGALMATLERLEIDDDTMVVYLHDNGPNSRRYTRGLRGMKGEVYEGGIRTPLIVRWPERIRPHVDAATVGAHIDLAPTILDACGVEPRVRFDGRSLLSALTRRGTAPERTLVIQSHRGNVPVRFHNMMVRRGDMKLVSASGFGREVGEVTPAFELYDLAEDPYEQHDLAAEKPDAVTALVAIYDRWFEDVGAADASNYVPPRIVLGDEAAPTVTLTRQDWRPEHPPGGIGRWLVRVVHPGPYEVRVLMREPGPHDLILSCGDMAWPVSVEAGERVATLSDVPLPEGDWSLMAASLDAAAYQVRITRLGQDRIDEPASPSTADSGVGFRRVHPPRPASDARTRIPPRGE